MTEKNQNIEVQNTQSTNSSPTNVTTMIEKEEKKNKKKNCPALYPSEPYTSNK